MKSLAPYISRTIAGEPIKLLIDTGAAKNYISPKLKLSNILPVENKFHVNSIHGKNLITHKCILSIFGVETQFFLLPQLETFEAIIGFDLMLRVGAVIDLKRKVISTQDTSEPIKFYKCRNINFIKLDDSEVPASARKIFNEVLNRNKGVFADINEALPFNTNVVATIRTTSDDPVYSKLYPYPAGVSDFVNKEIDEMLRNGIIRTSRSPYNNPIWVVDKKGVDELGNRKKRLVMDFRKLNDITIEDKYPIPNITSILSNLGKAMFFSTLDLKSGFHQIVLAEKDREKCAFSVNNGKYEFCRLAMGLKNAPSIFQRAIDDILRENIGKFCHVYMDDVIIYSETAEDHADHLDWVLGKLFEANMRVSTEKSHFFRTSVEYLGFVVSRGGIKTSPDKVNAILSFAEPKSLFSVRSFLGLAGYYRRFIKDYALIAKSLNDILSGENGKVSASQSKKVVIKLNDEQLLSFNKIKNVLASEDVTLLYPDYSKPFDLTTDASSHRIGAVLSQGGRPITMLSRCLEEGEIDFAVNERELLAIVWALKKLRNFLYGVNNINIFTDHQPLTFTCSEKNTNAKIKRWKAFIEDHNAKLFYKPGKENYVADALSRQELNAIEDSVSTIHSEESFTYTIENTENPVNCYRNQLILEESNTNSVRTLIVFGSKRRHIIQFSDNEFLFNSLQDAVCSTMVNAIFCNLPTLAIIQHRLVQMYPGTRFWHSKLLVIDVFNRDEQREIVLVEHRRAHRAAQVNVKEILKEYYFPGIMKLATEIATNCRICAEQKYERHPVKQEMGVTPIPSVSGELVHIDIFSTDRRYFLTAIDKFSKFSMLIPISSRTIADIAPAILQVINYYQNINCIYCDNEGAFNSNYIKEILDRFRIQLSNSAPLHSSSNGQVERFHSTLIEIGRCLKAERRISDTVDIFLLANIEYNRSIHSVTNQRPIDLIGTRSPEECAKVVDKLTNAQNKLIRRNNRVRVNRTFNLGDVVWELSNRRLGDKLSPKYKKKRIQADLGSTVLIDGRIVHKDNLK